MIVEFVQFKYPPGWSREQILADARTSVPRWRCRSTARLNPRLIARVRTTAMTTSTATVRIWRGCRSVTNAVRNDGFCVSGEGTTAPEG